MRMVARMSREPRLDRGVLVRSVVVHDDMNVQISRNIAVDVLEKLDELGMSVTRQTPRSIASWC